MSDEPLDLSKFSSNIPSEIPSGYQDTARSDHAGTSFETTLHTAHDDLGKICLNTSPNRSAASSLNMGNFHTAGVINRPVFFPVHLQNQPHVQRLIQQLAHFKTIPSYVLPLLPSACFFPNSSIQGDIVSRDQGEDHNISGDRDSDGRKKRVYEKYLPILPCAPKNNTSVAGIIQTSPSKTTTIPKLDNTDSSTSIPNTKVPLLYSIPLRKRRPWNIDGAASATPTSTSSTNAATSTSNTDCSKSENYSSDSSHTAICSLTSKDHLAAGDMEKRKSFTVVADLPHLSDTAPSTSFPIFKSPLQPTGLSRKRAAKRKDLTARITAANTSSINTESSSSIDGNGNEKSDNNISCVGIFSPTIQGNSAVSDLEKRGLSAHEGKQAGYSEYRKKNNIAAKKSREAKRNKVEADILRVDHLERENFSLMAEKAALENQVHQLRQALYSIHKN